MPSWSTRRFVLALCLFARESYEEVLRVLTSGTPGSRALARANRSSLCRARSRPGQDVLETLFREVAGGGVKGVRSRCTNPSFRLRNVRCVN
ncbi:transposase domain-containing protein, partial [Streptomyces yangpuensis]|uniref:transposase domain-containing protein n=1 Tax=Streptomyces yangpuensis TaxID=1648182 RepID=UPI0035D59E2E